MKKFAKIGAVVTALALAVVCFVSCNNGEDAGDPNGLWIKAAESENKKDYGYYIKGDEAYMVAKSGEDYYLIDKARDKNNREMKFEVIVAESLGLLTMNLDGTKAPVPYMYKVENNTLKLTLGTSTIYNKVNATPKKLSEATEETIGEIGALIDELLGLFGFEWGASN